MGNNFHVMQLLIDVLEGNSIGMIIQVNPLVVRRDGNTYWDTYITMGKHYFIKLARSGSHYIMGVGEVANYKITLAHKVT